MAAKGKVRESNERDETVVRRMAGNFVPNGDESEQVCGDTDKQTKECGQKRVTEA